MTAIELLAPAKNLACGIAAIDHGADAVYIGASHFGARAAAGNSIEDIARLCNYAHRFGAHVHVTVNTIIYNNELADTLRLVEELNSIGVDALLIQDMGLLRRQQKLPHPTLHASTQCDTRTAAKVRWLAAQGFSRVVLARELSAKEISSIHEECPGVELEAFVHGALCVSYSGQCYASQYCFNRSANRGECAQFCRLKFDLKDADGKTIARQKHLLSLKDLCQIDHLEELLNAGVCSLKIEGRLKDENYVKNVVAAYSERLNEIIARHPDRFCRASRGRCRYTFAPDLKKTFNRGYTTYFLEGRQPDIYSPNTPKALGECVGHVKDADRQSIRVSGTAGFANGDGLCFFTREGDLEGFRVNRAQGNRLYPHRMPRNIYPGAVLYRNNDQTFDRLLSGNTAERRIAVDMVYDTTDSGFSLTITPTDGKSAPARANIDADHQKAEKPQKENIVRQLSKLGDTIYEAASISFHNHADSYFLPSSKIAALRRKAIESMPAATPAAKSETTDTEPIAAEKALNYALPYLLNISNTAAWRFYEEQGVQPLAYAFELNNNTPTTKVQSSNLKVQSSKLLIMQCRHCLRYALGFCVKHGGRKPTWREPLHLMLPDGRRFRLQFACNECQMNIYAEK